MPSTTSQRNNKLSPAIIAEKLKACSTGKITWLSALFWGIKSIFSADGLVTELNKFGTSAALTEGNNNVINNSQYCIISANTRCYFVFGLIIVIIMCAMAQKRQSKIEEMKAEAVEKNFAEMVSVSNKIIFQWNK